MRSTLRSGTHVTSVLVFPWQVRDEYRMDFDQGRGGYGQVSLTVVIIDHRLRNSCNKRLHFGSSKLHMASRGACQHPGGLACVACLSLLCKPHADAASRAAHTDLQAGCGRL